MVQRHSLWHEIIAFLARGPKSASAKGHLSIFTRLHVADSLGHFIRMRLELRPILFELHEDGDRPPRDALLVANILVRGDQRIESRFFRMRDKIPVFETLPPKFRR